MKTPKKPQEVCETSTPSLKTPKNKMKLNTPKSEKQNLQKMVTPKSIKKNKQKGAQSPMSNKDDVMTPKQQKEANATNKTPKNKTPKTKTPENKSPKNKTTKQKIQNGTKKAESKPIVSDSSENSFLKSNKNPKKRTIDEVVSSKKKSKVENQHSQKQEPSNDSSGHLNLSDEVLIEFPPGAKCYKSALKQIVDMSDQISYPRNLVISFKNEADAKKNLPLMQKLQVGHQNIIVTQLVNNIDPLKKVVNLRPNNGVDPADVYKAVKSSSYSRLVNKTGHQSGLYVFTFASKAAADAAAEKTYDVGGFQIHLKAFFNDSSKMEEPITADTKSKPVGEKFDASAKKKSKNNVIAKKEEEDDDDDDDDDEDDDNDDDDEDDDDNDDEDDDDNDDEDDDDNDDDDKDDDDDDEVDEDGDNEEEDVEMDDDGDEEGDDEDDDDD